ncbi:hypothetical protein NST21_15200 [Peribacillus sp. FSL K6-1552]|uniref:hypothetical protein n=1 Tax=Peribacillus sp. FSL K6-1552 TaxID=2954514 RepID=UPI0030F82350
MKKYNVIFGIFLLSLLAISLLYFKFNFSYSTETDSNSSEKIGYLENNALAVAAFKDTGEPILDNELLHKNEESIASLELFLGHIMNEETTYGIIVMQDYIQSEFSCNGVKTKDLCRIKAKSNTEITIPLSLKVNPNTRELIILIVKEPDSMVKEMDIEQLFYYEQAYAKRYIIEGSDIKDITFKYKDPDYIYDSEGDQNSIFFSRKQIDRQLISHIDSNQKTYLHMGSTFVDKGVKYKVVAFENWNQAKINNETTLDVKTQPKRTYVYEVTTSTVNMDTNLQLFAFPDPFETIKNDNLYKVHQTTRTVIEPKN